MRILKKHIKIEYYRSSGPGGQRKDKKETAVRLVHLPTGIAVIAAESRSQARNLKVALERIEEKLAKLRKKKKRRIPTKVSFAAKQRRLKEKKEHSKQKVLRARVVAEP